MPGPYKYVLPPITDRAIVARGPWRRLLIVFASGETIERDMESHGEETIDVGDGSGGIALPNYPKAPPRGKDKTRGMWVWEGRGLCRQADAGDHVLTYKGKWRRPTPGEMAHAASGVTPWPSVLDARQVEELARMDESIKRQRQAGKKRRGNAAAEDSASENHDPEPKGEPA